LDFGTFILERDPDVLRDTDLPTFSGEPCSTPSFLDESSSWEATTRAFTLTVFLFDAFTFFTSTPLVLLLVVAWTLSLDGHDSQDNNPIAQAAQHETPFHQKSSFLCRML